MSVIVPTYRRPTDLSRCLVGLLAQQRKPDEIIVVVRSDDHETRQELYRWEDFIRVVNVGSPGQVAALKAGVAAASSAILAFTDDDAIPRPDWLERLTSHFAEPGVGAVGGRDVVHHDGHTETGHRYRVGVVTSLGRILGNHHLGAGPARQVDILKGVNCAYRRESYGAPIGLRGRGAEVANDLASSLRVGTRGQRVIYDPLVVVDHFPAERYEGDGRQTPSRKAAMDATFNTAFALLSLRPELRRRYLLRAFLVGDNSSPGIVRALYGALRGDLSLLGRLISTQQGIFQAHRHARQERLRFWQPGDPSEDEWRCETNS